MKKRILVIENDSDILDVVSYILKEEGYEVIAAEACPAYQLPQYAADLILLDEWVNKQEGHELCTEIKKIHQIRHIPVIIFSTKPNIEEIAEQCKAEGYLSKPFDLNELTAEVKNCLAKRFRKPETI